MSKEEKVYRQEDYHVTKPHNDLLRNIKGISNTMLSKSLKELEEDELVKRFEYLEIPVRVEYVFTEKAAVSFFL